MVAPKTCHIDILFCGRGQNFPCSKSGRIENDLSYKLDLNLDLVVPVSRGHHPYFINVRNTKCFIPSDF